MTFVDTNFFLALINDRDEFHDKAVVLAGEGGQVHFENWILRETS